MAHAAEERNGQADARADTNFSHFRQRIISIVASAMRKLHLHVTRSRLACPTAVVRSARSVEHQKATPNELLEPSHLIRHERRRVFDELVKPCFALTGGIVQQTNLFGQDKTRRRGGEGMSKRI